MINSNKTYENMLLMKIKNHAKFQIIIFETKNAFFDKSWKCSRNKPKGQTESHKFKKIRILN